MYDINERIDLLTSPIVETWDGSTHRTQTGYLNGHQYEVLQTYEKSSCKCYIVPPHLQEKIRDLRLQDDDDEIRNNADSHIEKDKAFRHLRKAHIQTQHAFSFHWPHGHVDSGKENTTTSSKFDPNPIIEKIVRSVYDARQSERLPGYFAMSTQGEPKLPGYSQKGSSRDASVGKALENALDVFLFYLQQYKYNSIDGKGMPITSTVHFGRNYENAFWNGTQMVYGDGSRLFKPFVNYLDVVGHEMTHGVTGDRLDYQDEAGALNESFSDVLGYLVYMYTNNLDVNHADWLLANGILQYKGKSYPLRSFKAPGTAYDIPDLGKDPQPSKYGDLYKGSDDDGGVHTNSGIPNHAFYLFAMALGGKPWEKAGFVWFTTMMTIGAFKPDATMKDFALATIKTADTLFKEDQQVRDAIRKAWKTVEVIS